MRLLMGAVCNALWQRLAEHMEQISLRSRGPGNHPQEAADYLETRGEHLQPGPLCLEQRGPELRRGEHLVQ